MLILKKIRVFQFLAVFNIHPLNYLSKNTTSTQLVFFIKKLKKKKCSSFLAYYFLNSLNSFCQNFNEAKDTSIYYYYAKTQNALYQIEHTTLSQQNKREKHFLPLQVLLKNTLQKKLIFPLFAAAVNLTASQIDTLINFVDTSLNKSP